jgi:phage shock protein E
MSPLLPIVLGLALLADPTPTHTRDSLDTVRGNLDEKKAVLIDVREVDEWKRGHLADANLVPLSKLRKLEQSAEVRAELEPLLPRDRIIYVHCASGVRVLSAAYFLEKLGLDACPLKPGFEDLRAAGFKLAESESRGGR